MKIKKTPRSIIFISLIFILILSSCSKEIKTDVNTVNFPEIIIETSSRSITQKLTEESELIPTYTLTIKEKQQVLEKKFINNGNCDLPCYWGITPGVTSWEEASIIFSSIGIIYGPGGSKNVLSYGPFFKDMQEKFQEMLPDFRVRDGIVIAILTNSSWVSKNFDYTLSGLLVKFGIPEEIWVEAINTSLDNQPYYNLVLWYPSKGIYFELNGNASIDKEFLSICPQKMITREPYLPWLVLWNPNEKVNFKQFGPIFLEDETGWNRDWYEEFDKISVDHLTNEDFYDIYTDPDTDTCITVIPKNL